MVCIRVTCYLAVLSLVPSFSHVFAQDLDTTRVLFVGNSYTYYNILPEMFADLSKSSGRRVEVDMSVGGGYSLEQHVSLPYVIRNISKPKWTYVVLQEQSMIPTIEHYRSNSMYPAARSLDSLIRVSGGKTVLFMTWARRDGGAQCIGSYCSTAFKDFFQMQDTLNSAYVSLANELSAILCPVGMAWKLAIQENPFFQLWDDDGSHPSAAGSYLTACTFYSVLFNANPEGLDYLGGLARSEAASCQRLAYNATRIYASYPSRFLVYQNYPNPFKDRTTITYSLPYRGSILVEFYHILGELIGSRAKDQRGPGCFDVEFYAHGVPSGVYVYRIEFDGSLIAKKMTVVK